MNLNNLSSIAIRAVSKACKAAVDIQKQMISADTITKKDQSPVTVADYTVQALVINEIMKEFKDLNETPYPMVAEEDSNTLSTQPEVSEKVLSFFNKYSNQNFTIDQLNKLMDVGVDYKDTKVSSPKSKRWWTLDPIDGTLGFLRNDQYAIALALMEDNKPVIGVLGCPSLPISTKDKDSLKGCLFYAQKNNGAFMQIIDSNEPDTKLSVSTQSDPTKAIFTESFVSRGFGHELNSKISNNMGVNQEALKIDSQCKYAMIARGDSDVYLRLTQLDYKENIWDHASGHIIVEEAGGKVTDYKGQPLDYTVGHTLSNNIGILCSNNNLYPIVKSSIEKSIQL